MKIVVTGAAGYIGAATVARLLAAGHNVTGLDCLRFGGTAVLGSYLTGRFTLACGDVRDLSQVARVFDGADAVVHLAAIVGDPACAAEPDLARAVNLDATNVLREAAMRAGAARFVFASTCSVYGHCGQPADETAPLHPLSLYAQTKADAEARLLGTPSGGMATTVLRFATVYGLAPRMRFDLVVNTFVAQALTTGRVQVFTPAAWRPLVHVADVADAVTSVVMAPAEAVSGQVFNVGSADNWQLGEVARLVARICGPGVSVDITMADGDHFEDLERKLSPRTKVVAFAWASNAVGTVVDAARVCSLVHSSGALAWVDAVHYAAHEPVDVRSIDADVLISPPYKFCGPHLGMAYARESVASRWRPYKARPAPATPLGRSFATGTLPYELLAGFNATIGYLDSPGGIAALTPFERALGQRFLDGLPDTVTVYGLPGMSGRVPTFLLNVAGVPAAELAAQLADAGIGVWAHDSWYSLGLYQRLGYQGQSVRIGMIHYNTAGEVDRLLAALKAL